MPEPQADISAQRVTYRVEEELTIIGDAWGDTGNPPVLPPARRRPNALCLGEHGSDPGRARLVCGVPGPARAWRKRLGS